MKTFTFYLLRSKREKLLLTDNTCSSCPPRLRLPAKTRPSEAPGHVHQPSWDRPAAPRLSGPGRRGYQRYTWDPI